MMRDAILGFAEQFAFEPKLENLEKLNLGARAEELGSGCEYFVIAGMGGSHLAADLLMTYDPKLPIIIHSDYGLPAHTPKNSLIIASSYSGNTEETIDAFQEAQKKGLAVAAVATGGKLLELAKESGVPYVQLPTTDIQPRSALGYSLKALAALMGLADALKEAAELRSSLKPQGLENEGHALAKQLKGFVPIIYSSTRNRAIAYNWKIKLNETGKIPAFYNVFPELNHNEMTGFDVQPETKGLSKPCHFIFLKDSEDDPRIQKRMEITERLYRDRKLPAEIVEMKGTTKLRKMFSSLVLADWTAYYTAEQYTVEAEQVPMVEEFKRLIAG